MGDRSGQAYAFMAVTPVRVEDSSTLLQRLQDFPTGEQSPLARMGTTHFARWLVLNDLVYQGPPQRRDHLTSPYLFFVSNFDGELDDYLDAMLDHMPAETEQIWSCCLGFPGIQDRTAFRAYLRHNQLETSFFVSAYPQSTVAQVRADLALRQRLGEFAITAQTLDAGSLQQAWAQEFAGTGR